VHTLVIAGAVLALPPIAGAIYQGFGARRDARRYPPPGRMVEIRGRKLHIYRQGSSGPAVILDAGISASSLSWQRVQPKLKEFAQVAAYDRAGLGWSERGEQLPRMASLVDDLDAVIDASRLPGPFVLVGHSFGGWIARHYAARHRDRLAALVLVDPLDPAEWTRAATHDLWRLKWGMRLSRWGALLARVGVVRFALEQLLSGSRAIPKFFAVASSGPASKVTERLVGEVRKLPQEVWPMVKAHWCNPKNFLTLADYLEQLPANCAAPLDAAPLSDLPIYVLSGAHLTDGQRAAHAAMAAQSRHGVHRMAHESAHWIHLDQPELVVEAVRDAIRDFGTL
jgi:pimeloyl-ACP methyl ester carboxylesterase